MKQYNWACRLRTVRTPSVRARPCLARRSRLSTSEDSKYPHSSLQHANSSRAIRAIWSWPGLLAAGPQHAAHSIRQHSTAQHSTAAEAALTAARSASSCIASASGNCSRSAALHSVLETP